MARTTFQSDSDPLLPGLAARLSLQPCRDNAASAVPCVKYMIDQIVVLYLLSAHGRGEKQMRLAVPPVCICFLHMKDHIKDQLAGCTE